MRLGLMCALAAFVLGVGFALLFPVPWWIAATFVCSALLLVLIPRVRVHSVALLVVLCVGSCSLGIVRVEFAERASVPSPLLPDGAHIEASGVVVREPDVRDANTLYTVELDTVAGAPARITVLTRMPHRPAYAYGDRLALRGAVSVPEAFETDAGRVFDYPGFLKKDGIHYVMRYPNAERVSGGHASLVLASLFTIKRAWLASVAFVVPEPGAGLLGGLVVGVKRSLGEAWLERFQTVGLVHIVVLSGFNLTIVSYLIYALCAPFSPRLRFIAASCGIVAFALMVGAGAAVARATIMALLGLLAVYTTRPYAVLRALMVAAAAMVAHNPYVLLFDPGFQLSVAATAGLIGLTPALMSRFAYVPDMVGLREIVATTFATQLAVLPLIWYQVGELSLVALAANLLVLPLVPVLMLIGFLAGALALLSTALALPLAYLAHLMLSYVFLVVRTGAELPYASITVPPMSPVWVLALYALAGGAWYLLTRRMGATEQLQSAEPGAAS